MTDSDVAPASSEIAQIDTHIETVRVCVACGYNLFGLGDQPRCPECGLRNIPDEFRRRVWELVDSGKWFFSGPLALFRRRPPGWWWALDRPGDLRRALRAVARNGVIAAAILFAGTAIGSSIAIETTTTYRVSYLDDPTSQIIHETSLITRNGFVRGNEETLKESDWPDAFQSPITYGRSSKSRVVLCAPNWVVLPVALGILLWLALTWVGPVFVGLVTQIRKGLPEFARPPLTIIAAGAYESHRLIYASAASVLALILAAFAFACAVRPVFGFMPADLLLFAIPVVTVLFVASGWVAPMRTDYTKQLIRSRGHAARIVIMYALLFPVLTTWALVMLVFVLFFNR